MNCATAIAALETAIIHHARLTYIGPILAPSILSVSYNYGTNKARNLVLHSCNRPAKIEISNKGGMPMKSTNEGGYGRT